MPTPLKEILEDYSDKELESFARDKIDDFEHLRLPKSVLIDELFSLLTDGSHLKDKLAYRSPPSYEILHVLLNSKGYEHAIKGFKNNVLKKTDELVNKTKTEDRVGTGENYELYVKMLRTAWHNEKEIKPNEANLLETLRTELEITFEEHFVLEHHQDIKHFWDQGSPFKRERNHLLHSGIIFTSPEDNTYIVPEEIAYQILDFWGIELDHEDYSRLLGHFHKNELGDILDEFGLYVSGTKDEMIQRIIENHIPVSKGLGMLKKSQLRAICKQVGCKSSGSKSQIIERLVQYIQYDRDLETEEGRETEIKLPDEEKILDEKYFKYLFQTFVTREIYDLLSEIPTKPGYGTKAEKIQRLWECSLSEQSLLDKLNKGVLRNACQKLDLNVSGTKSEIIERLIQYNQEIDPGELERLEENGGSSTEPEGESTSTEDEQNKKDGKFEDVPNFEEIQQTFSFLEPGKQVVLASLIEFESITEQEIDRIVTRYDLPWLFPTQEMEKLINSLHDHDYDIIEKNEVQEHNWYKIRNIEDFKWTQ